MSAALYFEYFVAPSLQQLKQRRQGEQGLADGLAGRPPASEAQIYGDCYFKGTLFRRADACEIVVMFGPACECPVCRSVVEDTGPYRCTCTPMMPVMVNGMMVAHGPASPDDEPDFMPLSKLRQLSLEGCEILTLSGERLNEQLFLQ